MISVTVQVPVIASIIPSSPVLLQSGDSVNLTCSAVGGPRLVLVWQRDGMDIEIGDSMVTHTIASASNNDLGQYTCQAFIDSELMESTVLVVGKISLTYNTTELGTLTNKLTFSQCINCLHHTVQ